MSAVEMGYTSGSVIDNLVAKPAKKTAEFRILLPDQSTYSFQLPRNSTGQECLDQICDILGIVERDYFSLQYKNKSSGSYIWLNKRLQVREQYGRRSRPPYQLKFAVRFYTDPELLLQPTTIDTFYKDLKYQIKRGDIRIPDGKKSTIGARLAQADFGDYELTADSPNSSMTFVYPPFYPNEEWNDGIAHLIAKEHRRLKGISKRDAQLLFLQEVYQTEFYGMVYVPSMMSDGQDVILAVGAKCIRIYNGRWTCIRKIPYQNLCQIAFALKFFIISYQTRDEEHQLVEKKLKFVLPCRIIAKALFRSIAEEQVFFFQETVSEKIMSHADNSFKKWKKFCHKMVRKKYKPNYYYDIQRTRKEAYRHSWQLLHQVSSATIAASDVPIPQPTSLNFTNINSYLVNDSDEEEDTTYTNPSAKSEVCWGLSQSSCNLAKELLPAPQLILGDSLENLLLLSKMESKSSKKTDEEAEITDDSVINIEDKPEPLSGAQGKKLRKLLLKIQDERLCTVCMDELISSVFCPCGHYVACNKCAKRLDRCPLCRQAVGYVQHVYTKF